VDIVTEEQAIAVAKSELVQQLGIGEDKVVVEEVMRATWRDTSLGCPQKGMMYAQVITPGYRVWLRVGDTRYDVHVGGDRAVVCQTASQKQPPSNQVTTAARMYELARQDLAARLDVPAEDIRGTYIKPTTWPDTRLGCPQADESYEQRRTEGFIIELTYGGKTYEYHGDTETVRLCTEP
jgi:hypothetical protein